ncbi:MAG: ABC transporter ATP-binding protein [Clostridia bacterium]|nr:ABC transporter ATP-binding protein [Clostridia bacterium]
MNNKVIVLNNIVHSFDGRQVLKNLSFSVGYGEKLIFNAPSGFGKSTIFNMIMGYVQPDSGSVIVDGVEVNEDTAKDVRSRIAFLPQNMALPNITLKQFVEMIEKFDANAELGLDIDILNNLFKELQLPDDVCNMKLSSLSGGEKQRLMLAIVIAMNKKILLLDEALSGVDIDRAGRVLNYLSGKKDLSIIFISHDARHIGVGDFREMEVKANGI